jgi:HlyD family secretion protein
VQVRIAFEKLDPRILPDMGIKVTFLREADDKETPAAQPTTLVPKAAIQAQSGSNFVFVVRGDAVARQAVRTAGTDGDRIEVLAGLHSGERVVVSPPAELKDGAKVIVK